MTKTITLFLISLLLGGSALATEERPHQIIKKVNHIEIRQYDCIRTAQVSVSGDRSSASSRAFRILFQYIQGHNLGTQKIAMTTPVSQQKEATGNWLISFYLPKDISLKDAPEAIDPRVQIKELCDIKVAAIRFNGRASQSLLNQQETILMEYLETHQIPFRKPAIYAFYNAPYIPGIFRRNEVLFELE